MRIKGETDDKLKQILNTAAENIHRDNLEIKELDRGIDVGGEGIHQKLTESIVECPS